jgi:hypothetical protein
MRVTVHHAAAAGKDAIASLSEAARQVRVMSIL